MTGLDRATGKHLSGLEHLRQSITDILTTPVGSRVMERDYGSRLWELIDLPLTEDTLLELYAATAGALRQWEKRLRLTQVRAADMQGGAVSLDLLGYSRETGEAVTLEGIVIRRSP